MFNLTKYSSFEYLKVFVKWIFLAVIVGMVGGLIGFVFHKALDYVAELQSENGWLIYLLPIGGVFIAFLYHLCKKWGYLDTNRVIVAAKDDEKVPLILAPLIFVSTLVTHLLGGSAGREGAALQLGGSIGYNVGKIFKLDNDDIHIIVMSGMSSVFAALFGTPLTAAVFAIEVVAVGFVRYAALVPCLISAITAFGISRFFGVVPVSFDLEFIPEFSVDLIIRVGLLSIGCALVSVLFCVTLGFLEKVMKKNVPNAYARAFFGGVIIILLTLVVGCRDYNGAGMNIITSAIYGTAKPEAFLLKILFTAITISSGFKGGEIVPTFFVGATFGCIIGTVLGISPGFGAAIGFIALFCGVVNCPIASILLAVEVFGGDGILFFAVACGISFMLSGNYGLYKKQDIIFSKLNGSFRDLNRKK